MDHEKKKYSDPLLDEITLDQVLKNQPESELIYLSSDMKLIDAIEILCKHQKEAAPVVDSIHKFNNEKRYIGFVDILDLVSSVLQWYVDDAEDKGQVDSAKLLRYQALLFAPEEELQEDEKEFLNVSIWCENVEEINLKASKFSSFTIQRILDMKKIKPVFQFYRSEKLRKVIEKFDIVKRVIIKDKENEIHAILTQFQVLAYLFTYYLDIVKSLQTISVISVLKNQSRIFYVRSTTRAVDAFYKMLLCSVGALAVVDEEGKLVANLSTKDLKGLKVENFNYLLLPVLEFLEKTQPNFISPPLVISQNSSLFEVASILYQKRIHRLWVVDSEFKPIGIVSLSDIMSRL